MLKVQEKHTFWLYFFFHRFGQFILLNLSSFTEFIKFVLWKQVELLRTPKFLCWMLDKVINNIQIKWDNRHQLEVVKNSNSRDVNRMKNIFMKQSSDRLSR